MNTRQRIFYNLNNRVGRINERAVLGGVVDVGEGYTVLREMQADGLVESKEYFGLPMYKLTFKGNDCANFGVKLAIDNSSNKG